MPHATAHPISQASETIDFSIGCPATLVFSSDSREGETEGLFVGYEMFNYIIFRLPYDFNVSTLKMGRPVGVKHTSTGNVYTYQSSVMHYLERFNLLFISYPDTFERAAMRKEDRVSCRIPATANVQKKALKGLVTDISYHGCQFSVKIPSTFKLQQVSVLTDIDLSLTLTGYTDSELLKGKVRNTNFDEFRIVLGIEFDTLGEKFAKQLADYIEHLRILQ